MSELETQCETKKCVTPADFESGYMREAAMDAWVELVLEKGNDNGSSITYAIDTLSVMCKKHLCLSHHDVFIKNSTIHTTPPYTDLSPRVPSALSFQHLSAFSHPLQRLGISSFFTHTSSLQRRVGYK